MNNKKLVACALSVSLLFTSAVNQTRQVPEKPYEFKVTMEEEKKLKKSRK